MKFLINTCFVLVSISSFAVTRTWTGAGADNKWSTAGNWGGTAPSAGDALVFSGATQPSSVNDFVAGTSFASIKLTAAAASFSLSGNAFVLTGGAAAIVNSAAGRTLTIANNLTFSTAAPTISVSTNAGNKVIINGTIDNGGLDITIDNIGSTETVTLGGIVSGVGGIVKNSPGTLALNGLNTYAGNTIINAGIVKLGSASALGDIGTTSTQVKAGAAIDVNGQTYTTVERVIINNTPTGAIINSSATASTFYGYVGLGSNSCIMATVGDIIMPDNSHSIQDSLGGGYSLTLGGAANGTIGNIISINAGGLTKVGTGTWTLTRSNPFTGPTAVNAGTLVLLATDNRSVSYTIASGAVLEFNRSGGGNSFRSPTFSGDGILRKTGTGSITWAVAGVTFALSANALIDIQAGSFIIAAATTWTANYADLTVASGATLNTGASSVVNVDAVNGAGSIVVGSTAGVGKLALGVSNGSGAFSGVISNYGSSNIGAVEKLGTGTQTLSGANTYTGTTTITSGQLRLGASEVLPDATALTVAATGVLNLNSYSETVGSVSGAGYIDNQTGDGTPTFKFGGNNATTTFGGVMQNTTGVMNVTKTGTGTIYLDGNNTYHGQTFVEDGFVEIRDGTIISN